MARLVVLALAVTAGVVAGQAYQPLEPQCFSEYLCIFHQWMPNGDEYSWDFRPLCQGEGDEYRWQKDPKQFSYTQFNICGTISQSCAPDAREQEPYYSHGVATQFLDPPPPDINGKCVTCKDADTGDEVCCTGQCEVLAHDMPYYRLLDPSNPDGGVVIEHAGMPPVINTPQHHIDSFVCPLDPRSNLPISRALTIVMLCDKSVSTLNVQLINETSACNYTMYATSKYACSTPGDPFDPYRDDPAHSFGFVVLGAALTIITSLFISFGDSRGWWDPIKRRLPASLCCCIRSRSSFGGGAYKGVGASSAMATPISASAYGST